MPVDFSPASNYAVEYARYLSRLTGGQLIFFHVVVPDAPCGFAELPSVCAGEPKEDAEENLRELVRSEQHHGTVAPKSIIRAGLPTHEIVEVAKELDVDLIVIASHGYTGWKHFCIGSTAERVVRAAPCPVLVVREKKPSFI